MTGARNFELVTLGDICKPASSNLSKKDLDNQTGSYPVYGANGIIGKIKNYQHKAPCIAVIKDGAGIGRVFKLPAESALLGTLNYLEPSEKVDLDFLKHYLEFQGLSRFKTGATIPHIYFKDYKSLKIKLYEMEEQKRISRKLNLIERIIENNNSLLEKLDELIKSRFTEMFGDSSSILINNNRYQLGEVFDLIDGDRGKNYPRGNELTSSGYCLFLNTKNVTKDGFLFTETQYISEEKDSELRKGKLQSGDLVLTTRGTVGNLGYYSDEIRHLFPNIRINSCMVVLRRTEKIQILPEFFIVQFKMLLQGILEKEVSGSAQPQLPIKSLNKISLIIPPIKAQYSFANLLKQINKSKVAYCY